jgi:hypothetical protein
VGKFEMGWTLKRLRFEAAEVGRKGRRMELRRRREFCRFIVVVMRVAELLFEEVNLKEVCRIALEELGCLFVCCFPSSMLMFFLATATRLPTPPPFTRFPPNCLILRPSVA